MMDYIKSYGPFNICYKPGMFVINIGERGAIKFASLHEAESWIEGYMFAYGEYVSEYIPKEWAKTGANELQ